MFDMRTLTLCVLLSVPCAGIAKAQSFETENGCATTVEDPCQRSGSCSLQGSAWDQTVTIDRTDLFDTMGWPGLCDQVHVALVQGACEPGGSQQDLTVQLSETSFAEIPQITGSLSCQAEPSDPPGVPAGSLLSRVLLGSVLAGFAWVVGLPRRPRDLCSLGNRAEPRVRRRWSGCRDLNP